MNLKLFDAIKEINMSTVDAVDYGAGNYVVTIPYDTDATAHQNFRNRLLEAGYQLYVDNCAATGEDEKPQIADYVSTATYVNDEVAFTLHYIKAVKTTQLIAYEKRALSQHLFREEQCRDDKISDAKTTLYNLPVYAFGDRLLIRLKNGHFIVYDGGLPKKEESNQNSMMQNI